MKFEKIFKRLPDADEINFRKYDISYCLKKNPKYIKFVNEKIVLRHEIERKYKNNLTPEFFEQIHNCYRLYLEQMACDFAKGKELHPLCEADASIQKVVKEFVESHLSFRKEMEDYLLSDEGGVCTCFKEKGLYPYLKKAEIEPYFFELKNSIVCFNLSFFLNEESKKIICDSIEDPDNLSSYDTTILSKGKWLFLNDEDGCCFSDGYEDLEEKEKERLEEEVFLRSCGWILEDDGK